MANEADLPNDYDDFVLPHAVAQTLLFQLAADMVRSDPERLWFGPTPSFAPGMYDTFNLVDLADGSADVLATFNALGGGLAVGRDVLTWFEPFGSGNDRAAWLENMALRCGLPRRVGALPAASSASLAVDWVAAFLGQHVGSRAGWKALTFDFADEQDTLRAFPEFRQWLTDRGSLRRLFTMLGHGEAEVHLVLTVDGDLWTRNREHFSLSELHREGQPITELVIRTVPHLVV